MLTNNATPHIFYWVNIFKNILMKEIKINYSGGNNSSTHNGFPCYGKFKPANVKIRNVPKNKFTVHTITLH